MKKLLFFGSLLIAVISAQLFITSSQTNAVDPSTFDPGRIIDDEVFYNKSAMNLSEIQSFLDSHVPACDVWGTQPSGYGNLNRAQYAQQVKGWPGPPYTCLNKYYENPSTGQTSYEMGGGSFNGGQSTAQIIYNASQQYGINPQVLLITLRKESLNLFADSWPMKSQYKYAMGYACPDSGPNNSANCDASYAGLYNQINKSAWQFRYYYDHMGSYNYAPGRWNTIRYSTDASCGSTSVYIKNYATASLYIYTPYTPNQGAINAYPGTAHCGAYGNRNFWYMWQEWFGSPYAGVHVSSPLRVTSQVGSSVYSGIPTTVSFDIRNDSGSAVDVGGMTVAVRDSSGGNHDFPLKSIVVPARSTVTYTHSQTFTKEDTYTFSLSNYRNGTWDVNYPTMVNVTEPRSQARQLWNAPSLTQGVTVQGGALRVNKASTVTYTVRNNSASTRTIGSLGLGVRGPNGQNLDPSPASAITLPAGQSRTLSFEFKPPQEGEYTFNVVALLNDWASGYPIPTEDSVNSSAKASALPQVALSAPLTSSIADLRTNQTTQIRYSVTNYGESTVNLGQLGISGRDPQGRNVDPGIASALLNPGETRVVSFPIKPSVVGTYTFGIISQQNGVWGNGPAAEGRAQVVSVPVKESIVLSLGLSLASGQTAYQGQQSMIQYTVKNYGESTVNLGQLGISGRDPQGRNVDPGIANVILNAGETRVVSFPISFQSRGIYTFNTLQTINGGVTWQSGPSVEGDARKTLTVGVLPGVTITRGLQSSVDANQGHVAQETSISYQVTNTTGVSLNIGQLGISGRDPQGRNVDPGITSVVLSPGEVRVISFPFKATVVGDYSFGVISYSNGEWGSGPSIISGQQGTLKYVSRSTITLTDSLKLSVSQLSIGQCGNLSFKVKNFDAQNSASVGQLGISGRDPQGRNVDPGITTVSLAGGEERVISFAFCPSVTGTYKFSTIGTSNNGETWNNGPAKELDSLLNQIQVVVSQ